MDTEPQNYWSDCQQVFFCGGTGYGLAGRLSAICLGNETDIKKSFETGEISDELGPTRRQVALGIRGYRKEADIGTSASAPGRSTISWPRSDPRWLSPTTSRQT